MNKNKKFFLFTLIIEILLLTNCISRSQFNKTSQIYKDSLDKYKKTIMSLRDSLIELRNNHRIVIDTNIILNPSIVRFNSQLFDVFVVDLTKDKIEFFYQNDNNQNLCDFESVNNYVKCKGDNLVFITNGGMFQKDISPLGAFYYKGKEIKPINLLDGTGNFYIKPNGVFCIDKNNKANIVVSEKFNAIADKIFYATQSGPMLVIDGKINEKFQESSTNENIRSGVGLINETTIVFAISNEPVSFYTFANLFKEYFGCRNALFLDGVVSEMYHPKIERYNLNTGFFGVMIGVVKKK